MTSPLKRRISNFQALAVAHLKGFKNTLSKWDFSWLTVEYRVESAARKGSGGRVLFWGLALAN